MVAAAGARGAQPAQPAAMLRQLAGTWTLVSIERPDSGGRLTSLPFPRGLLVLDSAGHTFEGVQLGRPQGAPALRFYEASGDALTVTSPATGTGQQQHTTVVTRKRLSGVDQMMPR